MEGVGVWGGGEEEAVGGQVVVWGGDEWAEVARGVGTVRGGVVMLAGLDVFLDAHRGLFVVALVDRVDLAAAGGLDVGVREAELSDRRVEREAVNTAAGRIDHYRRGSVDDIAGSHHVCAFLVEILVCGQCAAR